MLSLGDSILGVVVSQLDNYNRFVAFGSVCSRFHRLALSSPYPELFDHRPYPGLFQSLFKRLMDFEENTRPAGMGGPSGAAREALVSDILSSSLLASLNLSQTRQVVLVTIDIDHVLPFLRYVPNVEDLTIQHLGMSQAPYHTNGLREVAPVLFPSLRRLRLAHHGQYLPIDFSTLEYLEIVPSAIGISADAFVKRQPLLQKLKTATNLVTLKALTFPILFSDLSGMKSLKSITCSYYPSYQGLDLQRYSNPNLEHLSLRFEFATQQESLHSLFPSVLHLTGLKSVSAIDFSGFSHDFTSLKIESVSINNMSSSAMHLFRGCPLTSVKLRVVPLADIYSLANFPSLTNVSISGDLTNFDPKRIQSILPNVEHFSLSGSYGAIRSYTTLPLINVKSSQVLECLQQLDPQKLKSLRLIYVDCNESGFKRIGDFTNLRELTLRTGVEFQKSDKPFENFVQWAANLRELRDFSWAFQDFDWLRPQKNNGRFDFKLSKEQLCALVRDKIHLEYFPVYGTFTLKKNKFFRAPGGTGVFPSQYFSLSDEVD